MTLDTTELIRMIDKITQTLPQEREQLLRYFATLPEELRIRIVAASNDYYFAHRKEYSDLNRSAKLYCGTITELQRLHKAEKRSIHRKTAQSDLPILEIVNHARIAAAARQSTRVPFSERLLLHLPDLKALRHERMSYRAMSVWVRDNYKISISHESLRRLLDGK